MFCMAAQSLGYRVAVLEPATDTPAVSVADAHVQADYADPDGLKALAERCGAVTTEFENVPANSLRRLEELVVVRPSSASVAIAQDRIAEKKFIASCGLLVVPHAIIADLAACQGVDARLFPGILKVSRLGYDGKGQANVASADELGDAFERLGSVPCVLEKRVPLDCELSVVVVRTPKGQVVSYPVAQNIHRDGVLAVTTVPAQRVGVSVADGAVQASQQLAQALRFDGVMCVEYFVSLGRLIVNEIAPRPHNSGHFSIDACVTSQFEQQARVLAGLPPGSTRQHSAAVMINLMGDLWQAHDDAPAAEPNWAQLLEIESAKLHLYGKREARAGRKMGHVTVLGDTALDVLSDAQRVAAVLGVTPW